MAQVLWKPDILSWVLGTQTVEERPLYKFCSDLYICTVVMYTH